MSVLKGSSFGVQQNDAAERCCSPWLGGGCTHTHTHTHTPVTLATLHYDLLLAIVQQADRAAGEAGTGGTLCVVILPFAAQAGRGGTTLGAGDTPNERERERERDRDREKEREKEWDG